jgi:release factor glutamine methyltransferase
VHASVARTLEDAGCVAADEEADELIEAAGGDTGRLEQLVARRTDGEPLAWVTGLTTFCGLRVRVDPGVYVPRWQTEPLAEAAAGALPEQGVAVDLCTGAGVIAMVLQQRVPNATVIATELDSVAAACARTNGVDVRLGHLDDPLPPELLGRVDVITAVAPYVPSNAIHLLPRDVQRHEPRASLDGGHLGLDHVGQIIPRAHRWLRVGGWLFLEIGGEQASPIMDLLETNGFGEVALLRDEEDDLRGVRAQRQGGVK